MPVISKRIEYRRPQINNLLKVREEHTDQLGNLHYVGPYIVSSNTEADVNLANRDLTESLRERDQTEVLQWVIAGNDPNTFDFTGRDIIKNAAEERITLTFARSRGERALELSWWLDSLGPARWDAITTRLGWDTTRSDRVKLRANNLFNSLTFYNQDEDI